MDTGVYQVAHTLVGALTAALASTRAGAPCLSVVHPGTMAPDYGWCDCGDSEGIAWSRVVSITPSIDFPTPISRPVPAGQIAQLSAVFELGVTRCYSTPEDNSMPEIGVLDSMARDALDDAAAMLRAVQCSGLGPEAMVGPWIPRGPLGGIHGGTMTVTVRVDTCGCPGTMPPLDQLIAPLPGDPRT